MQLSLNDSLLCSRCIPKVSSMNLMCEYQIIKEERKVPARFPSHDTLVGTLKYTVLPVVVLTILTPAPSRGTTATLHTGHHEESAGPREPSWVIARVHRLHLDGTSVLQPLPSDALPGHARGGGVNSHCSAPSVCQGPCQLPCIAHAHPRRSGLPQAWPGDSNCVHTRGRARMCI